MLDQPTFRITDTARSRAIVDSHPGRPVLLDSAQTYQVLSDTVDHLESPLPQPWKLDRVEEYAHRIAIGTVGFRLTPTRVVAKAKLSQDESVALLGDSVTMLRADQPYQQPELAAEMHDVWLERTVAGSHAAATQDTGRP